MSTRQQVYRLTWHKIVLEIRYTASAFEAVEALHGYRLAHLQVQTVPKGIPLPVTETGYRSHYLPAREVEAYASPVTYVEAWLNAHAGEENHQLSLL